MCTIEGMKGSRAEYSTVNGPIEILLKPVCGESGPAYLSQISGKIDSFGVGRSSRYATDGCPVYSQDEGNKWLVNPDRVSFEFISHGVMEVNAEWEGKP